MNHIGPISLLGYATGQFIDPTLEFGPRWIRHHSKLFDPADIFIVCNHVNRDLYEGYGVNLINRDHPEGNEYDVFWEMATTYEAIVRLRLTYGATVFTSMDEFICTRKPIREIVEADEWVPCRRIPSYDVVHDPLTEPSLDLSRPTLPQRKFWKYSPSATHPAILYSGLAPALGWHSLAGIEPGDIPFAYGIILAHMKREDYSMLHRRTEDRQSWQWGLAKNQKGLSHHNKLTGKDLEEWFFQDLPEDLELTQNGFLETP